MTDDLATADVWTVLDLIVAEWTSDPTATACFDRRLVERAMQLVRERRGTRCEESPETRDLDLASLEMFASFYEDEALLYRQAIAARSRAARPPRTRP